MHVNQQIELNSSLYIDVLCLSVTHNLRLQISLLYPWNRINRSSKFSITFHLQFGCALEYVRKIEIDDIVAYDEIGVITEDQFLKLLQKHRFIVSLFDVYTRNRRASSKHKHCPVFILLIRGQGFANACDLYDRMVFSIRKAMLSRTFDIKWKDTKRRQFRPFPFAFQLENARLIAFYFYLTTWLLIFSNCIIARFDLKPRHSAQPLIDHKSQSIGNVRFKGLSGKVNIQNSNLSFKQISERGDNIRSAGVYFQVQDILLSLFWSVAANVDPVHGLKHKDSLLCQCLILKILFFVLRLLNLLKELIYG